MWAGNGYKAAKSRIDVGMFCCIKKCKLRHTGYRGEPQPCLKSEPSGLMNVHVRYDDIILGATVFLAHPRQILT